MCNMKEFTNLQKDLMLCKEEKLVLAQENEILKDQDASKETSHLKRKVEMSIQDLSSFTLRHNILLKLIGNHRDTHGKSGIGFDCDKSSDTSTTNISFVSSKSTSSKTRLFSVKHRLEQTVMKGAREKRTSLKSSTNPSGPKKMWVPKAVNLSTAVPSDKPKEKP